MAKPIDEIEFKELAPTLKALAKAGGTIEHADWMRSGHNAAKLIRFMDRECGLFVPSPNLIHGVFNKPADVLAAFQARCNAMGIFFGKFSLVGSMAPGEFDPDDPETVVVLDATLDTLQNTFEFAWAWTVDGQEGAIRSDGLQSDAKHLRLRWDDRPDDAEGDGPDFKPWTIQWVRIRLNESVGKKPIRNAVAGSSPGCALLFMSAEHPERIKSTDHEKRLGFWLPGLKSKWCDQPSWEGVPRVDFNKERRQVFLDRGCNPTDHHAVPRFTAW